MAGYQSCIRKQIADHRECGSKYHNLSHKMQNFMSGESSGLWHNGYELQSTWFDNKYHLGK